MWVALGAAVGGPLRFFLSGLIGRTIGETFPWGTLFVNVTGSFAIGALAAAAPFSSGPPWLFAVTGILGSYTTVSSFSLQTLALARDNDRTRAAGNAGLSLMLCLLAAASGFALAHAVTG